MNSINKISLAVSLLFFSATSFSAEQMDHSQHKLHTQKQSGYSADKAKGDLNTLSTMPDSGTGREAGYDKRYAMEPTSSAEKLADLCAKGSRGLIILDRKTWERCGGAPKGSPAQHDKKMQDANQSHQH